MIQELQGRARGKLLLFGEHSAVYGYPAVGIPLNRECRIVYSHDQSNGLNVNINRESASAKDLAIFSTILQRLFEAIPLPPFHGTFDIESSVPESGGFGSSGALCGALARLSFHIHTPPLENGEYLTWQLANYLETQFHGSPSGIDTRLSLAEGPLAFNYPGPGDANIPTAFPYPWMRPLPSVLKLPNPHLHLVSGAVPRNQNTKHWVERIRRGMETKDLMISQSIETLGRIAQDAIGMINSSGPWENWPFESKNHFSLLINRAHTTLKDLGLSTPELEGILEQGLASGFKAGKISGAGGGGAFYFLAENREQAELCTIVLNNRLNEKNHPLSSPLTIL